MGEVKGVTNQGDDSGPPTLVEGEAPGRLAPAPKEGAPSKDNKASEKPASRNVPEATPRPQAEGDVIPFKDSDTHTQPSLSALSDRPPQSLDIRRMWRIEEQFDKHDARIRLLEKELTKTRMLAIFALILVGLFVLVWLVRGT